MLLSMPNQMSIKTASVNVQDLVLVANEIGHPGPQNAGANADVNADGNINILDLVQVANNFGGGAPAAPAINILQLLNRSKIG